MQMVLAGPYWAWQEQFEHNTDSNVCELADVSKPVSYLVSL